MQERLFLPNSFKPAFIAAAIVAVGVLVFSQSVFAASYSWSSNASNTTKSTWSTPGGSRTTTGRNNSAFNPGNTTSYENIYKVPVGSTVEVGTEIALPESDNHSSGSNSGSSSNSGNAGGSTVTDHQMLSTVQDGYKGTITVTQAGANIEMVNQDLGQSGWVKIVNKENVPYEISMIVTENGATPDLTDLRNIVQWLRDNGMGDVSIADASEGRLVFTGLTMLTEIDNMGEEYARFVWDFSDYSDNGTAELAGLLAGLTSGEPSEGLTAKQLGVNVVPEPSTWCMLLIGLFVLGLVARRRMTVVA